MKKSLALLIAAAFALLLACLSCSADNAIVPVEGLKLDPNAISLKVGETEKIIAQVLPANANNKVLQWTLSDDRIVTVSSDGTVTAMSVGPVRITATTMDGGFSDYCDVSVDWTAVTGLILDKTALKISQGETYPLVASLIPSTATNDRVIWTSGMPSVAIVSDTGFLTAVGGGITTITATTEEGGFTAFCQVTVVSNPTLGLALDCTSLALSVGKTAALIATVTRADGTTITNTGVEWASSADSIASVSNEGTVTALASGSATITASYGGLSANCTVTVAPGQPVGYKISEESHTLRVGKAFDLKLMARNAEGGTTDNTSPVTWTTDNNNVARVNNDNSDSSRSPICNIRAVAPGQATITAQLGDFSAVCTVTVEPPDVYVTTTETIDSNSKAYLGENGSPIPLSTEAKARANGLFIADDGVVYVAGWIEVNSVQTAALWVYSGIASPAQVLGATTNASEAYSVHGFGGNIYVAGYQEDDDPKKIATIWKYAQTGSIAKSIGNNTEPSEAKSVQVANDMVYVAGVQNNQAALWTWDGTTQPAQSLTEITDNWTDTSSVANSVHYNGRYVYVAGNADDEAVLWVYDPTLTPTTIGRITIATGDTTHPAIANAVFTASELYAPQDIYVAGYRKTTTILGEVKEAVIWIVVGPVPNATVPDNSISLSGLQANSVFKLGNEVYVAGEKSPGLSTGWQGVVATWQGSLINRLLTEWTMLPIISSSNTSQSTGVAVW
jgi:uncharacterized protein YjdB